MCGGYELDADPEAIAHAFRVAPSESELPLQLLARSLGARYPGQHGLIVIARRLEEGPRQVRLLGPARFGLVPHFAKDLRAGDKHFNARAETVHERPMFRAAFERRRCLVPATAFYEWLRPAEHQRAVRYVYRPTQTGFLALAGIWDTWRGADGEKVGSFAILTTEANALVAPVHPRMPVILSEPAQSLWLEKDADASLLRGLLLPAADDVLAAKPG